MDIPKCSCRFATIIYKKRILMKIQSLLFTMLVAVLSFAQSVPTITSLSTYSAKVGSTVTITGTNFSATVANNVVYFSGVQANITSASTNQLVVQVPKTTSTSSVSVVTGGKRSNSRKFLLKNNSTGSLNLTWSSQYFLAPTTVTLSSSATTYAWEPVDVDNDGDMDFIAGGTGEIRIIQNIGATSSFTLAGSSQSSFTLATSLAVREIKSADFNNDGYIDFAVSFTSGRNVEIIKNNGNGTYTSQGVITFNNLYSSGYVNSITMEDFNNDGFVDVLASSYGTYSSSAFQIFSQSTTTPFSFSNYYAAPTGVSYWFTKRNGAADVNNDGYLDVFILAGSGTGTKGLNVALGTSTGFNVMTNISGSTDMYGYTDFSFLDIDNDGDLDVACPGQSRMRFYTNNGAGVFTYSETANASRFPELFDIDDDGDLDLIGSSYFGIRGSQNVSGTYATSTDFSGSIQYTGESQLIDLNGDGYLDAAFIKADGSTFYTTIFQGNPTPTITTSVNTLSAFSACAGSVSTNQSFTVSGSTLSTGIVITPPTGFEISSTSATAGYQTTALTLNQSGGTVSNTTIFVRTTTSATGSPSGNITLTSTGAQKNVSVSGTVNALPTLTTNPTTTLAQYCYNYNSTTAITVATSASSPTYQWQVSSDNTTFANVTSTNGSGGTTASFVPSHVDIWYGGTKYYKCVVSSNGCSTTSNSKPFGVYASITKTNPSSAAQDICINGSSTALSMTATGPNIVLSWQRSTNGTTNWTTVSGANTNTYTPPTNVAGVNYYRCYITATCSNTATNPSGAITVTDTYTWTGATSTDPTVAGNWSPAAVPCSGANEVIPSGLTNYPAYTNLTIDAGTTLTVQTGGRLTVTGTLTNNGTLTIESGATFLQGSSLAGSGTYNVKQFVTGAGGATPTGRFWYMGLPINNLTRATAFGTASGSNRLWSWSESGQAWSSQITDATALSPTTGYVFRTGADVTLNFSGTSLYSADANITGLTNTTGSFDGCHLMSNPYTAYLDWEQVFAAAGTTNLTSTYGVRSFNSTNSEMVYDTYNATGDVSVNPSGVAMTQYIAPMQSFWITVDPSTTGTLSMTKAMLSHQAGAVGLKDITSFPAFARLNLVSGNFYDQVVVYTDANANAELEDYDSKKFFLPNKAQVYCPVGNEKLVINALKQGKAQTSAPLTVELPSTQVYKFEMAESFVENGLVILEDKQEGIFQDMGVNPIYEFFGNSGVIADRFVLHFQLPNGTNNEGQAGIEDLTSGQIAVIANHSGAITVALSADLTTTGDIQIFDGAGRLVAQKAITSAQTSLQLSNGTGVYFVRVQTPMKTEMKKVMVY